MDIVARNILVTILGEDINDEKIELQARCLTTGRFTKEKLTLSEAIMECLRQIGSTVVGRLMNPLHLVGLIGLDNYITPL